MKKATYTVVIVLIGIISFVSCKKEYHCQCSYNNQVEKIVDMGNQTKSNAQKMCSSYDTTVPGEVWNCIIY